MRTLDEILERFRTIEIPERFDLIVAIAAGGIVPAGILAQRFPDVEVRLMRINLRDEAHKPRFDEPKLLAPLDFDPAGRRILLVDDRIKSGSTVALARKLLAEATWVRTFAVNGAADYALFDEPCFRLPWMI